MGQGRFAILNLNDGCSNRIRNRDRQQRGWPHHRLAQPPCEIQLAPAKHLVSVDPVRSRHPRRGPGPYAYAEKALTKVSPDSFEIT